MMTRKAGAGEFEKARSFYHSLIDGMKEKGNVITWVRDVYPSPEFLKAAADAGELHFGIEDGEIAAAMVLNNEGNEAYADAGWPTEAEASQAMVIHALGVHPRFGGRGFGAKMVQAAIDVAKEEGMKAVRLDVLKGNEPARRIYVKCGFKPIGWVRMFYENTGTADFELFEYAI